MLKIRYILRSPGLRSFASQSKPQLNEISLLGQSFAKDDCTNINEKICSYIGKNIYQDQYHPLSLVRQRIVNYFYKTFTKSRGNPVFSVYDRLSPIVSTYQNFDSLLIPKNHPSRQKSDCYYINREYLLRAHMTAHQNELIRAGLNNFLMIGDVYRRDEIDRTHFPVFHQVDAVRLKTKDELFESNSLSIFEEGNNEAFTSDQAKQACHSLEAVKVMEHELKETLVGLAKNLFGDQIQYRWVDVYFPFTQPSWELEVYYDNNWMELLGCGIMQHNILANVGVTDKIGWAFGLGLERIAMCLYQIPDIRLFWSKDTGFLSQFKTDDVNTKITYVPISQYPQCKNDLSFWLPETGDFSSNDLYDIARSVGENLVEQIELVDDFKHPKTGKRSHCYRITYRHMEKTLTQAEANLVHEKIAQAVKNIGGIVR